MKKLCKTLLGVVCLLGILIPSVNVNAQPNEKTLSELEEKIKKYDEIISKYDNKSEQLKNELDKNKNEVVDKFNDLKMQWSNEKVEINNKKNDMNRNLALLLSGITLAGIGSIAAGKKFIDDIVEKEVTKYLKTNAYKLTNLIKIQDNEELLMQNKKILVLSDDIKDKKEVETLLMSFKHTTYKKIDDKNKDFKNFDVIFLNNIRGKEKQDIELKNKMIKLIEGNKDKYFFYFNITGSQLRDYGDDVNLNYASSKVNLVSGLVNLLKYQDMMK